MAFNEKSAVPAVIAGGCGETTERGVPDPRIHQPPFAPQHFNCNLNGRPILRHEHIPLSSKLL